jgi:mono/diheme cytochrome c family protein
MRTGKAYSIALLVTLLLAACGAGVQGDPLAGRQLFNGEIALEDQAALPCSQCHSVEPGGNASLGPNLSNIGARGAAAVPGQSAEEYLRTSIVDPDAHLAGGFQDGLMYRGYGRALTAKQIDDLVVYMLTLKSGQDG